MKEAKNKAVVPLEETNKALANYNEGVKPQPFKSPLELQLSRGEELVNRLSAWLEIKKRIGQSEQLVYNKEGLDSVQNTNTIVRKAVELMNVLQIYVEDIENYRDNPQV
jgi:hypothetical protein